MVRGLPLLVMFSLALGQGQAWAERDDPDPLIAQGLKAMLRGDYQAALDAFQRAHQARPATRSHAEIGLAEQALHRWVEAEADLTGALAEPEDAWLESHRALLEKALADVRSHLGMLTVESGPRGAEVKIDGERRGTLPLPRPLCLLPGTARVEITAPGRRPWRAEATIQLGETTRLAPIYEPLDPPPVPVMPAATTVARPHNAEEPRLAAEPKALKIIGWLALAAGSAAAGSGAFLLASDRHAGSSRRLAGIECLALGSVVALSGGVIAVVTAWRSTASGPETAAEISFAGRF
jgi:tetratricopeptide (TPR) repeat protein